MSRDVTFLENEPYFKKQNNNQEPIPELTFGHHSPNLYREPKNEGQTQTQTQTEIETETETKTEAGTSNEMEAAEIVPLRISNREIQRSTKLRDFITYQVKYPIQEFISYDKLSNNYKCFLSSISKELEPNSYQEAIKSPAWCKTMEEELHALEKNRTWKITQLPKEKKLVGCKWVYKIKYNGDGTIEKYKARLVDKGYTQTYGIDYHDTFAPIAKMNTIRILLSVAVNNNQTLYQMDVKNVFLQGTLDEEIYMNLPSGYKSESGKDLVCKLEKSIYGLKQSPRA
jgi:Reverse transcriptase (RNA-dependent DNA polymerase)